MGGKQRGEDGRRGRGVEWRGEDGRGWKTRSQKGREEEGRGLEVEKGMSLKRIGQANTSQVSHQLSRGGI